MIRLGGHQAFDDQTLDGLGGGQPPVALGSGIGIPGEAEAELILDQVLESEYGGVEAGMKGGWCRHESKNLFSGDRLRQIVGLERMACCGNPEGSSQSTNTSSQANVVPSQEAWIVNHQDAIVVSR